MIDILQEIRAELAAIGILTENECNLDEYKGECKLIERLLVQSGGEIVSLRHQNEKLQKRIAELEAAARWVPVGEMLPAGAPGEDWSIRVECLTWAGFIFTGTVDLTTGHGLQYGRWALFGVGGEVSYGHNVTHWRPLPATPEAHDAQD